MGFTLAHSVLVLLLVVSVFATTPIRDVLFDDLNDVHYWDAWEYQHDTLTTYGVGVHYTSDEAWSNIMVMDMVWIQSPSHSMYTTEEIAMFQDYVRNNGRMLIGIARDPVEDEMEPMDRLLTDSRWQTTLGLFCIPQYCDSGVIGSLFVEFFPFTADIGTIFLSEPTGISCGHNAFPFAFAQNYYDRPVAAISFPFLDEGNCSSFIVLITGNHAWEDGGESFPDIRDTYIFARNILLTMAGVEGYEFDPCAFADSMLTPEPSTLCSAAPNPFTPNGDGINDEAEFEFPGLGTVPGTIKIFTLGNLRVRTIEVPTGSGAKEAAKWDGRDDSGAPMRPGIYIYTIRAEGRIKCDGTITLAL